MISLANGGFCKNVVRFGVDMSSSMDDDKNIS